MPRLGGAFTFGESPISVSLGSGGVYYPPPGNYYFTLPTNLLFQVWNPLEQYWYTISNANNATVDGVNYRFLNATGICTVASFTAGSGATNGIGQAATGVTLAASAPGANGIQATLFPIVGGAIGTPTITTAGAGLVEPPVLIVAAPPKGGRRALLTCTISAGAVNGVTVVDAGAGYTAVPQVWVIPQLGGVASDTPPSPGAAATFGSSPLIVPVGTGNFYTLINAGAFSTLPVITAGALTGSGTLTGAVVINPGSLYTGTPTVTVTGAGAATVTLSAVTAAANISFFLFPTLDS